jgi:hypothetical protein
MPGADFQTQFVSDQSVESIKAKLRDLAATKSLTPDQEGDIPL